MVAVIQRVSEASVKIDGVISGAIDQGFVILLGICNEDSHEDIEWLSKKICGLRIFSDSEGKMNLNIPKGYSKVFPRSRKKYTNRRIWSRHESLFV